MKVLIVGDYSIAVPGGAQIMARQTAEELNKQGHVAYRIDYAKKSKGNVFSRSKVLRELRSIFNPYGVMRFLSHQIRFRPDVIWFQNINNHWSWSILRINPIGAKKFITLHDLTAISNYKLTPDYLNVIKANPKFSYRRFRIYLIKIMLQGTNAVAIGDLNMQILSDFGIQIESQILNQVRPCEHSKSIARSSKTILYAGRTHLKGLDVIAKAVHSSPEWKLAIAGDEDSFRLASQYCSLDQIIYLGYLTHDQLLASLHDYEFVSVCSQYYDNYPTIGLEALVHGSIPITTSTTGLAKMLGEISPRLVLSVGEVPNLNFIKSEIQSSLENCLMTNITTSVSDTSGMINQYLTLFRE